MSKKLQVRPIDKVLECMTKPNALVTKTSKHQSAVEKCVREKFSTMHTRLKLKNLFPQLHRELHKNYLLENIWNLSYKYESLDASRPWLCYWIVHALSILGVKLEDSFKNKIATFLGHCQSPNGGFGGGPAQFPHLAPTYAAVNTLVILGTEYSYKIIDRKKLYEFLLSVRQSNGSFAMHVGGEVDIRGTYCALAVASLTNIITKDVIENTAEWIASCQTYEGGFAGFPGMEAHGGYTFCGLAALVILGRDQLCDKSSLLRWLVNKQMSFEGGFQGRTNKLVDGCYSFWQGAAFPILYSLLAKDGYVVPDHLFDERALQEYILFCCQYSSGGLIDKPGKMPDVYHTCYTLSGLSIAQYFWQTTTILGPETNKLEVVHPLYNIRADLVKQALLYFSSNPGNQEDMSCGFV